MRAAPLYEVELSVKRDDCKVSNALSKLGIRGNLINLNIGVDESSHLLDVGPAYKDAIHRMKSEGVRVTSIKRDKIIALSTSCSSCKILAKLNSVVLSANSPNKNVVIYRLLTDNRSLKRVTNEFEENGIDYYVINKIPYVTLSGLTPRQSEVVIFALINGYFDVKRRINLSSIAQHFSIKPATVDLILRRALRKIVYAQVMRKI